MEYKLSVLLCSLPNRLKKYSVIEKLDELSKNKNVQILYIGDNKSMSVGEKRNMLLSLAKGEYVCFVDDDDRVSDDYIDSILDILNSHNVDCINFKASVSINGSDPKICLYSKMYKNINTSDLYYRKPNHLMVWRRTILCKFDHINIGEDTIFGEYMSNIDYSEYCIDKVLYYYDFDSNLTEAQKR